MKSSTRFPYRFPAGVSLLVALLLSGVFMVLSAITLRAVPTLAVRFLPDVPEHAGMAIFNLSRQQDAEPSSVDYTVSSPSGRISPASGCITFLPNAVRRDVDVTITDNNIPEADFYIILQLSNPVNLVLRGDRFLLYVLDNDRRFITVTGGTVTEGNASTKLVPFTITQCAPIAVPFTFNLTTKGTAVAGEDYTAVTASATIPTGAVSTTVTITVTGDTQIEEDETIELTLSGLSHPVAGITGTPATILTDDFPPGPEPSATLVTEASGTDTAQAWFAVDLSAARTVNFSCRVSTRNGTAFAGSDYNALPPATVTFAPGEVRKWVAITVKAAPAPESREHFFLDVEALDSREVKSAACTIERLTITDFWRQSPGIFALRFPAGLGQRYVIEEASLPNTGWTPVSTLLSGAGFPVTQFVFADASRIFYRVRTTLPLPPGTAAAGS